MSDEPENLVLVYLRRLDAKFDRMAADLRDMKNRMAAIEVGMASLRREVAVTGEAVAILSVRVDRLDERIERIERRLDIVSA